MLTLISPFWLLGLGALAIPIALHLWSRRPSQVVRLGTLAHLEGAPGAKAWGRRLDDVPMLALRIAILLASIAGLAGPTWLAAAREVEPGRTHVVADPTLVADSLAFYSDPLVDSLRRSETPIHLLADRFPVLGPGITGIDAGAPDTRTTWSRLQEFDRGLGPNQTIVVLARPAAGRLGHRRPELGSLVRWHAPHPVVGSERVADAWPSTPDSGVRLVEILDSFSVSRRLEHDARVAETTTSGTGLSHLARLLLNSRSVRINSVQTVAQEGDRTTGDVATAAMRAALLGTQGYMPTVDAVEEPIGTGPGGSRTAILWLNGQSVHDSILNRVAAGAWLFEFIPDTSGNPSEAPVPASWVPPGVDGGAWIGPLPPDLGAAPLWQDVVGQPLVTAIAHGSGRWYRIGVRGTDWATRAAADPVLPELLHALLTDGSPARAAPVGATQARPMKQGGGSPVPRPPVNLAPPLFLLALLLLGGERLLVHRRQRGQR